MDEALNTVASEQGNPASGDQNLNDNVAANAGAENEDFDLDNLTGDDLGGDDELVDMEINGKTYKLHRDLKDRVWYDADYTQKSQANAELKKSLEARQAEIDQAYNVSQEVLQARAAAINVDAALKRYEGVNWEQLEMEDPVAAMSHYRQFQQLQQQRNQIAQYLDKTQGEMSEKAAQAVEARLRETRAYAEKELRGWTLELDQKITEFALKDLGFTVEDLRNSYSPQIYQTLYLAFLGQKALSRQSQQQKPDAPAVQPLSKVATRANPPAGLDDRLSQEEWLKRRNAQVNRR